MIIWPVSPRYNIRNWVTDVFDGDRYMLPYPPANDADMPTEDEAWLSALFHSNQNTANFITHCLTKMARGEPGVADALEDWVSSLDILTHNYRMVRRNPTYEDL